MAIDNVFADRKRHKIGKKDDLFLCSGKIRKRKDYGRLWFVILFSCLRLYAVYGLYVVGYERQRANAAPFFFLAWPYSVCKVAHQKYCQHGVSHAAHLSYIVRFGVYL